MADKTGISWTDATWNPIVGCSVVSPGCTNCYAQSQAARIIRCSAGAGRATHYEGTVQPSKAGPVWTGKVALAPDSIMTQPLRWRKGRRIFVNSMGDLFHEAVPDEWIDRAFAIMALAPQHTYQVLTKRSTRMREYLADASRLHRVVDAAFEFDLDILLCGPWGSPPDDIKGRRVDLGAWPLANVWAGVTAEDQARADERIPDLLATPAALRFVSVEPMLGPVDLRNVSPTDRDELDALSGFDYDQSIAGPRLDWVIAGGESGPGARPMHPDWVRWLRGQCAAAAVPFFFKQWGEYREVETPAELIADDSERADELFNRAVNPSFIQHDGTHIRSRDDLPWNEDNAARLIERIGTARAGHLLDGREHHEFPGVPNG